METKRQGYNDHAFQRSPFVAYGLFFLIFFIHVLATAKSRNKAKVLTERVICQSGSDSPAFFMKPRATT